MHVSFDLSSFALAHNRERTGTKEQEAVLRKSCQTVHDAHCGVIFADTFLDAGIGLLVGKSC